MENGTEHTGAHANDDQAAPLRIGVDVGSTTVKAAALAADDSVLATIYRRHHAHQAETALDVLNDLAAKLQESKADAENAREIPVRIAVTGSGGAQLAKAIEAPFVQEVVANSIAVAAHYPTARVAIELGGQDAKMIFFEPSVNLDNDPASDGEEAPAKAMLKVADMRMNGSCARGTGAFLDEIATLLKVPTEDLNGLAAQGTTVYSISGRCGVFAKTDIQPLINQGAAKEDIALSTFHAVAKQTLGGLAQGLDVIPPIIFEGGPLTFNPTLVRVFAERLRIGRADIIIPDQPETIVARGAALSLDKMFAGKTASTTIERACNAIREHADDMRT